MRVMKQRRLMAKWLFLKQYDSPDGGVEALAVAVTAKASTAALYFVVFLVAILTKTPEFEFWGLTQRAGYVKLLAACEINV